MSSDIEERRQSFHCPAHVNTQERVATLEALEEVHKREVRTLFAKIDDHGRILNSIKICTESINGKLETYERDRKERFIKEAENHTEYTEAMVSINKKFIELDKSKWFHEWVNRMKDSMPMIILKVILWIIAILAILHWLDVGRLLKKMMGVP